MTNIAPLSTTIPETSAAELNGRRLTQVRGDDSEQRAQFKAFAGQTVFGQMLASMRKTVDKPAYFHGGRAEEVFQSQMDQVLSEKLTESSADQFIQPMWELMNLRRQ